LIFFGGKIPVYCSASGGIFVLWTHSSILIPIDNCHYDVFINNIEPCSWRGVLYTTLCDKVCQLLATGRWFSSGTPVSSTNKTNCHDITEILLKVALNTIKQTTSLQILQIYAVILMYF